MQLVTTGVGLGFRSAMTLRITQLPHELASDETALEPLSPELVLVDPDLARAARARLAPVGDSLAFRPRLVAVPAAGDEHDQPGAPADPDVSRAHAAPPVVEAADQAEAPADTDASPEHAAPPARADAGAIALQLYAARAREYARVDGGEDDTGRFSDEYERRQSSRRWLRAFAMSSLSALVGAVAVYVFIFPRVAKDNDSGSTIAIPLTAEDGTDPGAVQRTRGSSQAGSPSAGSPTVPRKNRPRRPQPNGFPTRVFVWPPVAGATFYRVEFFRHGARIFVAWPSQTRLVLPLHWTYRGRRFRLTRATYHWRVRPAFGLRSRPRYGNPSTRSTWVAR